MRSNSGFYFIIYVIAAYFLFIVPQAIYGQEPEGSKEDSGTIKVVEQALKNYDTKKQSEQEDFKTQLSFRLGQATKAWVAEMEKTRYNQWDTVIEQDWDKQARIAMILPVNYVYYLRGYKYSVVDSDIIKSESLNPTYKAVVNVKEELYAERSHHGNISDIKPYLYTVTHIYTLNFIYKNNDFTLVSSDAKMESMINEISSEVRKEWLWRWL